MTITKPSAREQGLGAAFVVTGGIALIANVYTLPAERAHAFASLGVMSGLP